jgi:hypothetical protein
MKMNEWCPRHPDVISVVPQPTLLPSIRRHYFKENVYHEFTSLKLLTDTKKFHQTKLKLKINVISRISPGF